MFQRKNHKTPKDQQISVWNYFKQEHNISLKRDQPLLLARRTGQQKSSSKVALPVEVVYLTGVPDDEQEIAAVQEFNRKNNSTPTSMWKKINAIERSIFEDEDTKKKLKENGLEIGKEMLEIPAHRCAPVTLLCGDRQQIKIDGDKPNFSSKCFQNKPFAAVPLNKWAVIYPGWYERAVDGWLEKMEQLTLFEVMNPLKINTLQHRFDENFIKESFPNRNVFEALQIIVVIIPQKDKKIYCQIKQTTTSSERFRKQTQAAQVRTISDRDPVLVGRWMQIQAKYFTIPPAPFAQRLGKGSASSISTLTVSTPLAEDVACRIKMANRGGLVQSSQLAQHASLSLLSSQPFSLLSPLSSSSLSSSQPQRSQMQQPQQAEQPSLQQQRPSQSSQQEHGKGKGKCTREKGGAESKAFNSSSGQSTTLFSSAQSSRFIYVPSTSVLNISSTSSISTVASYAPNPAAVDSFSASGTATNPVHTPTLSSFHELAVSFAGRMNMDGGVLLISADVSRRRNRDGTIAMVSTYDHHFTQHFFDYMPCAPKKEMIEFPTLRNFAVSALGCYRLANRGCLPSIVILYRDGVGEGQLAELKEVEDAQLRAAFAAFSDGDTHYTPAFAFIVVCKRIQLRSFLKLEDGSSGGNDGGGGGGCNGGIGGSGWRWGGGGGGGRGGSRRGRSGKRGWERGESGGGGGRGDGEGQVFGNVPYGTVIDSHIVSPLVEDWYLQSHHVPNSFATASPTRYIVLANSTGASLTELEEFSNALAYLYTPYPGPLSVPAVLQYAHKLSLFGQTVLNNQGECALCVHPFFI